MTRQKEQGQALVEFALVAIFFVMLILVGLEGYRLWLQRFTLDEVARESTRLVAETGGATDEVLAFITLGLEGRNLNPDEVTVTVQTYERGEDGQFVLTAVDSCLFGQFVRVKLEMAWQADIPPLSQVARGTHVIDEHLVKCEWEGS